MTATRKFLIFFLLLFLNLFSSSIYAQDLIGEIKISENEKNITNLSGALNDSISFHIIINKDKNTNEYVSTIHFYNESSLTKQLFIFRGSEIPVYLAFHVNNSILTLTSELQNKIVVTDVDYLNEKVSSNDIQMTPKSIFSHKNITYLVRQIDFETIDLAVIKTSDNISRYFIGSNTKSEKKLFTSMFSDKLEFINDQQFIEKGSLKKYKGFYYNENLVFIFDDENGGDVEIYIINNSGVLSSKKIIVEKHAKIKKMNSFLKDNFLFTFYMLKDVAYLNIYDMLTLNLVKRIDYTENELGPRNKVVVNGVEQSNDVFNPKAFYNSFFPQAIGSVYNPELYIGVNKSVEGNYILQIGHADKNNFYNESAFNFWWSYPAFQVNYNISSGIMSVNFNPNSVTLLVFEALASEKRKGNYFELQLDKNLTKLEEPQSPEYHYIDVKSYNNRLKNVMKLKNHFLIILKNTVRLINFDKESDSYKLYNLPFVKYKRI